MEAPLDRQPGESADDPCYIISVAAKLVQMHPQTLRYYERLGLIKPARSDGKIRLYSVRDVERLRQIHQYIDDLGVNLAGVEVILRMTERMAQVEQQMRQEQLALLDEIRNLRQALGEPVEIPEGPGAAEGALPAEGAFATERPVTERPVAVRPVTVPPVAESPGTEGSGNENG